MQWLWVWMWESEPVSRGEKRGENAAAARGLSCWQALNVGLLHISLGLSLPLHFGPEAWEMEKQGSKPSQTAWSSSVCGGTLLPFYINHSSMIIFSQNQHLRRIELGVRREVPLLTGKCRLVGRMWSRLVSLSTYSQGCLIYALQRAVFSLGPVCQAPVSQACLWWTTLAGRNNFFFVECPGSVDSNLHWLAFIIAWKPYPHSPRHYGCVEMWKKWKLLILFVGVSVHLDRSRWMVG